ncbi:MAG: hypothetical protein ACYS18_11330 [Planctomycetota bacterium]
MWIANDHTVGAIRKYPVYFGFLVAKFVRVVALCMLSDATNDWCDGGDLDQLGDVDGVDLRAFVQEWLDYCPGDWALK